MKVFDLTGGGAHGILSVIRFTALSGSQKSEGLSPVISEKTIGRLSLYRRLLRDVHDTGQTYIFSHDLAAMAGCTPAQVRRDVMSLGFSGNPARGYAVDSLIAEIGGLLDAPEGQGVALVGVGDLGRALLTFIGARNRWKGSVAAFDNDPEKTNRVIHGCRCYPVEEMEQVVREQGISLALITVPAEAAQETAGKLCRSGVRGLVNFAPVRLWVPEGVYVENVDVTMTLERVAYYARQQADRKG